MGVNGVNGVDGFLYIYLCCNLVIIRIIAIFVGLQICHPKLLRRKGSVYECESERNAALIRAYHREISRSGEIRLGEVFERISLSPCDRFWVSEERCTIVMRRMEHGDRLTGMLPLRREMYEELYSRYILVRKLHPDWTFSRCCRMIVVSPAPKFYMTPLSVREMIYRIKREWYRKRKMRLGFMLR